jgi:site-specific DNA recombinase
MDERLRGIALPRISTYVGQAVSRVQQTDEIYRWAQHNGTDIIIEIDETDSVKGSTTDREGLQRAMWMLADDEADVLVVYDGARFSRNLTEGLVAIGEIKEMGKRFVAVMDGIDTAAEKGAMDGIKTAVVLAWAQAQLEQIAYRWLDVRKRAVARGVQGRTPYGYMRVMSEDGRQAIRLEPDPKTAPVVRRMYEERLSGRTWQQIAEGLNADAIPPPGSSKQWSYQTVAHMLGSEAHLGICSSGPPTKPRINKRTGKPVKRIAKLTPADVAALRKEKAFPPLVERDVWEQVVAMKQAVAVRSASACLLTGVLRCGSCGGRMVRHHDSKRNFRSYRCQRHYTWGDCPKPAYIAALAVEEYVVKCFVAQYGKVKYRGKRSSTELDKAKGALAEAQAQLNAFLADEANDRLAVVAPEAHAKRQLRLMAAVERAGDRVRRLREQSVGVAMPQEVAANWDQYPLDKQRQLVASVYPLVAVRALGLEGRGVPPAIEERVTIWKVDDHSRPRRLPGLDDCREIVPLL